jgi:hypothetical protein
MSYTLSDLKELEQFDDDAEAQEALREIERESSNPATWQFWFAIAVLVISAFATIRLTRWLIRPMRWPGFVEDLVTFGLAGVVFWIILRWLHRADAPADLRRKLLKRGIPVCLACGYSLRGQPPASAQCPECGAHLDEHVRQLIDAQFPPS